MRFRDAGSGIPGRTMKGKIRVLYLLALAALLAGLFDPLTSMANGHMVWLDMVMSLSCAILVFTWYYLDSDERSYRRTPMLNIMVVAAGVLAIPYYLFRSRGAQRGLQAVGLFMLALLTWFAIAAAGLVLGEWLFPVR